MKKIYIAPSNQNANMYYGGKTNEAEQCRKVANALVKLLSKYDCKVRVGNDETDLTTKCTEAKLWAADVYLSIHSNGFNGKVRGTECWFDNSDNRAAGSKKLAQLINTEMAKIFPTNRGLKTSNDLIDCYLPVMPSCICEMGFHDNKEDSEIIIYNTDKLAQAFCTALVKYLELNPEKEETEYIVYTVKKGDTLYNIAETFNTTVEALVEFNNIENPDLIYPNQKIKIPTEKPTVKEEIKVGSKVKVKQGAKDYNGVQLASFVYKNTYDVIEVSGNRIVIGIGSAVTAAVHKDNLILI